MPRYDGNGPFNQGSMTGWGMGPCNQGQTYSQRGLKRGQGLGWRRFWGYCPASNFTKKEETEMLSEEAEILEDELKSIKKRLTELKGQK